MLNRNTKQKKNKNKTDSLEITKKKEHTKKQKKQMMHLFELSSRSLHEWSDDCPSSSVLVVLYFESLPRGNGQVFQEEFTHFLSLA